LAAFIGDRPRQFDHLSAALRRAVGAVDPNHIDTSVDDARQALTLGDGRAECGDDLDVPLEIRVTAPRA
jgi:hypothetical protein